MHPLIHPLFIQYITHFNGDRDYFECHEVLEDYWKEIDPGNKKHPLVGWIQLSTSLYHWRRNNVAGSIRMMSKSISILSQSTSSAFVDGINMDVLLKDMNLALHSMKIGDSFSPFKLIIEHSKLIEAINESLLNEQYEKIEPVELINKHMLRDRSHILLEREEKRRNRNT